MRIFEKTFIVFSLFLFWSKPKFALGSDEDLTNNHKRVSEDEAEESPRPAKQIKLTKNESSFIDLGTLKKPASAVFESTLDFKVAYLPRWVSFDKKEDQGQSSKVKWTREECNLLYEIVSSKKYLLDDKQIDWPRVAETLNITLREKFSFRSGEECKRRWKYINPEDKEVNDEQIWFFHEESGELDEPEDLGIQQELEEIEKQVVSEPEEIERQEELEDYDPIVF